MRLIASASRSRLRLTRIGWGALVAFVVVLLAAFNTANNLLFALASILLAALALSALLAPAVARRVGAELLVPAEVRAGEASEAAALLRAPSRRGAVGLVLDLHGLSSRPVAVPLLRAGEERAVSLPLRAARRGAHRVSLDACSVFPMGLVEARRVVGEAEVLVLPRSERGWRAPEAAPSTTGNVPAPRRGQGAEILDIRDWRSGDEARTIDWKATARLGKPMVREFEREREQVVAIVVDPTRPRGPVVQAEASVEDAISRAAGAAEGLAAAGWRLSLVTPGKVTSGDVTEILRGLARLAVSPRRPEAGWWERHVQPEGARVHFSAPDELEEKAVEVAPRAPRARVRRA